MICPKCKKTIDDKLTVCPYCKKVLALVCPRCGNISDTSTCSNCGYVILSKCIKCGTLNKTEKGVCAKCGEDTKRSAALKFTENEHFSAITIQFMNIAKLAKVLGNKKLVTKFLFKLKSMVSNFAKEEKAYFLMYNDFTFILNYASETSEYISAQKAMKSAIKLLNILCSLNRTLKKELMFTLETRLTVEEKPLSTFFDINEDMEKVKLLDLYSEQNSETKGMQLTADQYIYKFLRKEYKMDSLYTSERDGNIISYYAVNASEYIIPVKEQDDEVNAQTSEVKVVTKKELDFEQELYKKNIEGIKVKCKFEQLGADKAYEYLKKINFQTGTRVISLRGEPERQLPTSVIEGIVREKVQCYTVVCSENLSMTPWGFFRELLKEIYGNSIIKPELNAKAAKLITSLLNLSPPDFDNAESARLAYIETFLQLLTALPQSTIYIENFEYVDIASRHVLEEIFSKINKTKISFIVTNAKSYALQKIIPELLNSYYYIEIFLSQLDIDTALSQIIDSEDFKNSFYYKKIKDNAGASYLYCLNAVNYLKDSGAIITFNNKTVITDSKTVVLPFKLEHLINTRLKKMSKETAKSLILAYSYILGPMMETSVLGKLGLNNIDSLRELSESGFIAQYGNRVYIQNYENIKNSFKITLKPEVLKYLGSNLINKVYGSGGYDYCEILSFEYLGNYTSAFSKLYELSIVTLQFGDYDAYLKMCIKMLKYLKELESDIPEEELAEYQSDFYNNLTQLLYRYAPERIYPIAENLLHKAVKTDDKEKIVILSNMMLQGGLLTSNYTNTVALLQNILERTENCTLTDKAGNINYRIFSLSLVGMEICFYTGQYDKCIQTGNDLINILTPEKISKLRPNVFTEEQFNLHILDSLVYYLISHILTGNYNLEYCLEKIEKAIGARPVSAIILEASVKFLRGEKPGLIDTFVDDEYYMLLSKLYNAFVGFDGDFGVFAANIYDFKKTASEQGKQPFVLLGDLLIGYAYKALGGCEKAEHIYNNVLNKGKECSLFFIIYLAKYLLADLSVKQGKCQTALQVLTNSITILEKTEHPCVLLLYLLKKKFIEIVEIQKYTINIDTEKGFIKQIEPLFNGIDLINLK